MINRERKTPFLRIIEDINTTKYLNIPPDNVAWKTLINSTPVSKCSEKENKEILKKY